ncbi:magnesium transporter, partial [bacterium]|nr:magnesium transporter [bacterium]
MKDKNIFGTIRDNIQEVLQRKTSFAKSLWLELVDQHPVDIAEFITNIDRLSMQKVFLKLPKELKFDVFEELSDTLKAYCLSFLTELDQVDVLHALSIDDLTDLFDYLSDEELKRYLNLLHKRSREKVLSLLKFDPDSAGGIMDIEVLALMENYTVEKSIKILQRLRPDQEVYHQIYVTNKNQQLAGHINLEDLVLQTPKTRLSEFLRKNQLVAQAYEDQESIAKRMVHYNLTTVPVVGADNHFLGVIPSETLMDVLVEEASEDVQKMAALAPMKRTYLEMPVYKILISRGSILVVLLLAESVTGSIIHSN